MATTLKDALVMVAASWDLGPFSEDSKELDLLLSKLREIDVESCEDFRLAFVTDHEVDEDSINGFGVGPLLPFQELLFKFAEELIPDGAFTLSQPKSLDLKKRSCPSHVIGGRLVYRKLEDYLSKDQVPKSSTSSVAFQPSSSTSRLRASAVNSVVRMEEKIAKGFVEDKTSHLLTQSTSLHERADGIKVRAIDLGFLILKEMGPFLPSFLPDL